MEPLTNLTPRQRVAALAFWYMSEVNNGGHFQYFVNKCSFPHAEVVDALRALGATHSAHVLASALEHLGQELPQFPEDAEEYCEAEQSLDLRQFDHAWGSAGDKEINACLATYLKENESEFVTWVA